MEIIKDLFVGLVKRVWTKGLVLDSKGQGARRRKRRRLGMELDALKIMPYRMRRRSAAHSTTQSKGHTLRVLQHRMGFNSLN